MYRLVHSVVETTSLPQKGLDVVDFKTLDSRRLNIFFSIFCKKKTNTLVNNIILDVSHLLQETSSIIRKVVTYKN